MSMKIDEKLQISHYQQLFKLKNLYRTNKDLFFEVVNYMPFYCTISDRFSKNVSFGNSLIADWIGDDIQTLLEEGTDYVASISEPNFFKLAVKKIQLFNKLNNPEKVCYYLQYLTLKDRPIFLHSYKIILDDNTFLNIGYPLNDIGKIGRHITSLLDEFTNELNGWEKYHQLTKQEKNIAGLLGLGLTQFEVAEQLFISAHTVKTHTRNIYKKLDISRQNEIIKYTQVFELL